MHKLPLMAAMEPRCMRCAESGVLLSHRHILMWICEKGTVQNVLSVFQMRNMNMTLEMTNETVLLTLPNARPEEKAVPCINISSPGCNSGRGQPKYQRDNCSPCRQMCCAFLQFDYRRGRDPPWRVILWSLSGLQTANTEPTHTTRIAS